MTEIGQTGLPEEIEEWFARRRNRVFILRRGKEVAAALLASRAVVLASEHEGLREGVGALVATTRCDKRPESGLDHDPGPCGSCAVCRAKRAYYGDGWRDS